MSGETDALRSWRRIRTVVLMLIDGASWTIALVFAAIFRYELAIKNVHWGPLLAVCAITVVLQLIAGWVLYLYRGRHTVGSFHEARSLLIVLLIVGALVGIPVLVAGTLFGVPRSTVIVALPFAFVLMGAARYLARVRRETRSRPSGEAERTIVVGAGYLAQHLIPQMLTDPSSRYVPVAVLDDDAGKRNLVIHGVRVRGTLGDLIPVARATRATTVVLAIARADSALIRQISDLARTLDLRVKTVPALSEALEGRTQMADLHDVSIEDLIGRHPVDTEISSIAGYLEGKRVLVTGAGGSIGSVLCREVSKFGPAELIMLDRDESGLQVAQISLYGNGLLQGDDTVLLDIRDRDALIDLFAKRRPDVVFHAAALKHLPMLEAYPDEAWKTNVVGTLNVLDAARGAGVTTFINISTDKAADPSSILGRSKRLAEQLTASAAAETGRKYLSVRFGNVLGSRGSLVPTFAALLAAGRPLTVTDPEVTRFFMTIPEACQLVVQAGGIGRPGEVLVLDMGEPIRIVDIAQRMIEMSGAASEIVFTGLRPGEKMHEVLFSSAEGDSRPFHPKISHTTAEPLAAAGIGPEAWYVNGAREPIDHPAAGTQGAAR